MNLHPVIVAIDPGVGGGIAYQDTDGVHNAFRMPKTLGDIKQELKILCTPPITVYLEELPKFQGKMSGAAVGVMFANYGRIEGILATLECRVEKVPPKVWQKKLSLGGKATYGDRWKAHLKERAQELNPHLTVSLHTADALLILEAVKRK